MYKNLKVITLIIALTLMTGCGVIGGSGSALTTSDQAFISACDSYNASIVYLMAQYKVGNISKPDIANINTIRAIVVPVCTKPAPQSSQQAIQTMLDAVANLESIKTSVTNTVTTKP